MKRLVLGPGAMALYAYLGVLSKFKKDGHIDDLEEISCSSAGSLAGFLYCLAKGDIIKVLDYAMEVKVDKFMKPNLKILFSDYGLVSNQKVRDILSDSCNKFIGKDDVTFQELYEKFRIKLHVSTFCVNLMKTVYFSVDSSPGMSVLEAVSASIAIPFLFSSVKMKDGWRYIDGSSEEEVPGAPFLGYGDVLVIQVGTESFLLNDIKNLKNYAMSIIYSTMKMRRSYDFPYIKLNLLAEEVFNFSATSEEKLKIFLKGYEQASLFSQ